MESNQPILLISAQAYSFTDDTTGVVREGTSIHYILPTAENGERFLYGHRVTKSSIDSKIKLDKVPGLYKVKWDILQASKGISLKISSLDLIKPVEMPFK